MHASKMYSDGMMFRLLIIFSARLRVVVCAATMVCTFFLFTQKACPSIATDYTARRWGVEDGLPETIITSIGELADGFLWLTTPRYVVRFDGTKFEIVVPGGSACWPAELRGLFQDRKGGLWVYGSEGVMRREGKFWSNVPVVRPAGNESGPAQIIETPDGAILKKAGLQLFWVREVPNGEIWAAANDGIYKLDGHKLALVSPGDSGNAAAKGGFSTAAMDGLGRAWLAGPAGIMIFDGHACVSPSLPPNVGASPCVNVFAGYGNSIWLKLLNGKSFRSAGESWAEVSPAGLRVGALLESRPGETWLGAVEGLYLWRTGEWEWFSILNCSVVRPWDVRCLYRMGDGSTWVGAGSGLYQFRIRNVRMSMLLGTYPSQMVSAILPKNTNELWVAMIDRTLLAGKPGTFKSVTATNLPLDLAASALLQARDGSLWVGFHGNHLWRIADTGPARQFRSKTDMASRSITCLLEGGDKRLWVGSLDGLLLMKDEWLQRVPGAVDTVLALCEDGQGRIWVGTQNSGLLQVSTNGVCQSYRKADGLPSDTVRQLYWDESGVMWIGTSAGLARWKLGGGLPDPSPKAGRSGRNSGPGSQASSFRSSVSVFTREQGLLDDDIRQMLDDGNGCLWLGARRSLMQVRKSDLRDLAEGRSRELKMRVLGAEAGLLADLSGGGNGPLSARLPDGTLWFATQCGLATIDPAGLPEASPARPLYIENHAGDSIYNAKVRILSPGCRDIQFRFVMPDFEAPERVRYRHFLEGYDLAWSVPAAERSVVYSRLPPGEYRLRVMACSAGGVWREAGAPLSVVMMPFFWQTWWFGLAAGVLVLAGVGLGSGLMMRKRARRKLLLAEEELVRERAVENERARIARDVHDEIGAGLTEIAMQSDWIRRDIAAVADGSTRKRMEHVCNTAVEMVRSVDGIVWAVNPANDTVERFVNYLTHYTERFLGATGRPFRVNVSSPLPTAVMAGTVRHGAFQAVREALNNAVKHAGAGKIELGVHVEDGWLIIIVRDDGCGFDAAAVTEDGTSEGLGNMRSRMEKAGGRFELVSRPGTGTSITFGVRL